jgi:hypothetical protein
MQFHAIGGPLQLVGLVSADQELVVLGDGVIYDREYLAESFPNARGVAVVPAYVGVDAGFERVDAQYAWGGLFIARGQIVEQLAEMPADSDTISLLLRIALQAGTKPVTIDADRLEDGSLLKASSQSVIENREKVLLDRSSHRGSWLGPGNALAQIGARKLATNWISRGPALSFSAAITALIVAAGLTFYSLPFWALIALLSAALAGSFSVALFSLKAKLLGSDRPKHLSISFNVLLDLSIIASIVLPLSYGWEQRLFLAAILLGSWRLAQLISTEKLESFWQDRSILIGILIGSALLGIIPTAIQLLVLTAMAYCLFHAGRKKITQA